MSAGGNADQLRTLERNVEQAKIILRNGGRILTGTDAPIDFLAVSLHLNLRGMVKFGISPYEALLTATRFGGEFLEEPIGVIAPNALADLLVVNGDPLRRIADAANVSQVIKNGEVFAVGDLLEPFRSPASVSMEYEPVPALRTVTNTEYWWHHPDYVSSCRSACCA
jgi:adenine deaminase